MFISDDFNVVTNINSVISATPKFLCCVKIFTTSIIEKIVNNF